jgi:transcriptional regulator with XRE-family HTH domain
MASHKLPNYLRQHRKHLGFSQRDIAFLLGGRNVSRPCRYEHFSCTPVLRTALALAVILRVPVQELFSGEYQEIESVVRRQAQRLRDRLTTEQPDERRSRKLAQLRVICER